MCAAWPVYLRVRGVAGLLKPHAIRAAPRLLSQLLLPSSCFSSFFHIYYCSLVVFPVALAVAPRGCYSPSSCCFPIAFPVALPVLSSWYPVACHCWLLPLQLLPGCVQSLSNCSPVAFQLLSHCLPVAFQLLSSYFPAGSQFSSSCLPSLSNCFLVALLLLSSCFCLGLLSRLRLICLGYVFFALFQSPLFRLDHLRLC